MLATEMSFISIAGIPVAYDRGGSRIRPTFRCSRDFHASLTAWVHMFQAASYRAGLGRIVLLVTAGFFVNKAGEHGRGNAGDLDLVVWEGGRECRPIRGDHASLQQWRRRRYLGTEGTIRQHFRWVLNGHYPNHADHFHFDTSGLPVRLSVGSKSDTLFIQAVCNDFNGAELVVDGVWGPKTRTAFDALLSARSLRQLQPLADPGDYKQFLRVVTHCGLTNRPIQ